MSDFKQYLGDGAYVDFDGYHVILTAENGIEATDTVALEPEVFESLLFWHRALMAKLTKIEGER